MAKNRHRGRKNRHGKKNRLYSAAAIRDEFLLSPGEIARFFPEPEGSGKGSGEQRFWTRRQVEETVERPIVARAIAHARAKADRESLLREEIRSYLLSFDVEKMRREAMKLDRRFVLHIGPTNSGKTYQSLQALKQAKSGVYLGPLRLLALEMFDTMNRDGVPCSLLTGEESISVFGSYHTSSTIELADYGAEYDVAVIDEAQMVTDPHRGDKWLRAIYGIRAKEVHICLAPEARDLIVSMLRGFGAPFETVTHERLAPLVYSGLFEKLSDAQDGDALIVFSRKAVLAVSAELDRCGIRSSVIYGALPPVSRREEVRRFTQRETRVVVATDAIGMGLSLPIRRVVFCETTKFDGERRRPLLSGEIKQIAGRAGRFGIFDTGEVLTMAEGDRIRDALACPEEQKKEVTLPFPEEAFLSDYPPDRLLAEWNALPDVEGMSRVDMTDARRLYDAVRTDARRADRRLLYRLITCPVDTDDESMVAYWLACTKAILASRPLPEPPAGTESLASCEERYRQLDIRHQLLRQTGVEEDRMAEKMELCALINRYLKENKTDFVRRCRECGRALAPTYPYSVCEMCFEGRRRVYRRPPAYRPSGSAKRSR